MAPMLPDGAAERLPICAERPLLGDGSGATLAERP